MTPLTFHTIDLETHQENYDEFQHDAFVVNYGDDDRFERRRYDGWLRARIAESDALCVHASDGERIGGDIEAFVVSDDPTKGYVSLFYLMPDMRCRPLGPFTGARFVA